MVLINLQETFAYYTARTSFERPLLNGVAYAQRVLHAERELFETHQGWTIKTMKREPSPMQDEYAPVIYSQETVSYIEALDMMSGEVLPYLGLVIFLSAAHLVVLVYSGGYVPSNFYAGGSREHFASEGHRQSSPHKPI